MWNEMPEWVWYVLLILRFRPGRTGTSSNAPLFVSHNLACNYAAGTGIKTLHELLNVCVCVCFYLYVCATCAMSVPSPSVSYAKCLSKLKSESDSESPDSSCINTVCASNFAILRLNLASSQLSLDIDLACSRCLSKLPN